MRLDDRARQGEAEPQPVRLGGGEGGDSALGQIWVEAQSGPGACFSFKLPVMKLAEAA